MIVIAMQVMNREGHTGESKKLSVASVFIMAICLHSHVQLSRLPGQADNDELPAGRSSPGMLVTLPVLPCAGSSCRHARSEGMHKHQLCVQEPCYARMLTK